MNKFFAILCVALVGIGFDVKAEDDSPWVNLDRAGIYKSSEDGQITRNVWKGYSQSEAVALLDKLPNRLQSPSYRELAKRLLLSDSLANKREDITSPALLAKRISLLIDYGLFDDARALYNLAVERNTLASDFDLALLGLQFAMMDGDITPICLDIEALSTQFRDMSGWKELSNFCQLRFGGNKKISVSATSFEIFPILRDMLVADSIGFQNDMTSFESLAVFADSKINDRDYNTRARDLSTLPDIAVKLSTDKGFRGNTTYQCYVIEGAKRGLITPTSLATFYKSQKFSDDIISHSGGEISLHPCDIPAYFYQRLSQNISDDDISNLVSLMMTVSAAIPAIAFTPMTDKIQSASLSSMHKWRADIIVGMTDNAIGDSNMPLQSIQKSNQIDKKIFMEWLKNENNAKITKSEFFDSARLLYISHIISGDLNKLKQKSRNTSYENLFSLTYGKKSLGLGLGFNDFIAEAYADDNHAATVVYMLSALGSHDPHDVHVEGLAVILSAMKAYKLEKNAIALSFEHLQ